MSHISPKATAWIRRISDERMPVLGNTITEVSKAAGDDDTPRSLMVNIILRDPSMTSHVLRLSNSAFFGARGQRISTISRAVLLLGYNQIRNICVTLCAVSELLKGDSHSRLLREMGRAFHAAVQAREFAARTGDPAPEEVFIAALLLRLGEMAFWCFGEDHAKELDKELGDSASSMPDVEDKVLGFRLSEITAGLAEQWRLSPLLVEALNPASSHHGRVQTVQVSHKLAQSIEHGWESQEAQKAIDEVCKITGMPAKEITPFLHQNAREAVRVADAFGAGQATAAIPLPPEEGEKTEKEAPQEIAEEALRADTGVQLQILRELTSIVSSHPDVNTVIALVLEGMFRGAGMERTLFALLTPDRTQLLGKSCVGLETEELLKVFNIPALPPEDNIFAALLNCRLPCWLPDRVPEKAQAAPLGEYTFITGDGPFFAAPAIVDGKCIGLFYADRRVSGNELDQESYDAFCHFALVAGSTIELLKR